jgi:hypothetical protein
MTSYARGWMFGALCSMSALAGGWTVAAALSRTGPGEFDGPSAERDPRPPHDRQTSDHLYFSERPRLIAC